MNRMKRKYGLDTLTKGEKFATGFEKSATNAIHTLSAALYKLGESKEHKQLRIATSTINHYVSWYLNQKYDCMEPIDPMIDLAKDVQLQEALSIKGISKEEWIQDSLSLLNIAPILALKEDKYYKNTPEYNQACYESRFGKRLRSALDFFNISKETWIKYGIKILTIFDIYEEENRAIIKLNGKELSASNDI